jgi:hypothetical protein
LCKADAKPARARAMTQGACRGRAGFINQISAVDGARWRRRGRIERNTPHTVWRPVEHAVAASIAAEHKSWARRRDLRVVPMFPDRCGERPGRYRAPSGQTFFAQQHCAGWRTEYDFVY